MRRPTFSRRRPTPGSPQVNYGYTNVAAPFDGIVTAHLVSVGELVGVASPTQLATIVALDPIYVNFNVNEQDVLRMRAEARAARHDRRTTSGSSRSRSGCRPRPAIRTRARSITSRRPVNQSTGTLAVRGILPNPDRVLLPGYFVRVRVPLRRAAGRAAGSRCRARQRSGRPLCAGGQRRTMSSSSARCRSGRWRAICASSRAA